jgi:alpha-amylase/alpha-mannosidase (GH57 family)
MPLANSHDMQTQVFWGIQDFRFRFRREPEGMWLPETAVDLDTLEILARNDIKFTILSPTQALRMRKIGEKDWIDVSAGKIDPKRSYLVQLPSGKNIAVFFYDGPISHDIAFGDLLKNGEHFAQRLLQAFSKKKGESQIVHIATDGESYGHHHRFGDMALAYCLDKIGSDKEVSLTVYGEFLENHPPEYEVEIVEKSSWSCIHGVERWRSDCGCNTGQHPGWTQAWRAPLREAMDWLRDQVLSLFEKELARFVRDPWKARDAYIQVVLNRSDGNVESYFSKHQIRNLSQGDKTKVLRLLELQRNAMLMYTSCGWFFDDISGIETVQVMKYAGRTIQLAKEIGEKDLEPDYIERIAKAPSNDSNYINGAEIYKRFIRPAVLDLLRIGAHYAVSSLFEDYPETTRIGEYTVHSQSSDITESGSQKLAQGKAKIHSDVIWEEEKISYVVLYLGDHNLIGGVRRFMNDQAFSLMQREIMEAFKKGDIPHLVRLMDRYFGAHNYSLWHLLRDKKRQILNQILESALQEAETSLRQIYENQYSIMSVLRENNIPLPKAFSTSLEFILNADFRKLMETEELDFGRLKKIIDEFKKWDLDPDKTLLGFVATLRINKIMTELRNAPENVSLLEILNNLLETLDAFPIDINLWKSQNVYFKLCQQRKNETREKRMSGKRFSDDWIELMEKIGQHLRVKCL